ncbi:VOC family protein [Halomicrobium salinisoli]|uniref:VOC family protein n=1 Tax=Halomicrobium salinisoli TaxID=2878391 RepID=UPI001CEFEC8B|nr:VOC family protein [Halomicrobium salinisoli]
MDELPPSTRVGRVALRVGDVERVADFYERVVGLRVRERSPDRVVLGADEPLLVLESAPDLPERRTDEAGLYHVAFRVPSRAALGDALARVESEWELTGATDHLVSEALYLTDPDGNGVEIYLDRPRGEWPVSSDGRVEMATRPLALGDLREAAAGAAAVPDGTDVGHVHLAVTDLDRSRRFYVDALGLRVRQALGDEALFTAAGDYHHHVGLNTWEGRSRPASGRGLAWFELVVPDADALAGVREVASGASDLGLNERDGGLETADPDGIGLRLRAPK